MSRSIVAATLLAALWAVPVLDAAAQNAQPVVPSAAAVRDPGDPKAAVPPVVYASAFQRYRPNAEVDVGDWRRSNDTVGRIGGWRVYGREAIADTPASTAPANREITSGNPAPKSGHGQPN